jgi:hypothetical protein
MPNPSIKDVLGNWLEQWIPRKTKKEFYNARSEPGFAANRIDVENLRGILASAEAGNVRDLFGLYRDVLLSDSHLQAEFTKRKLAVLGDTISIQPVDRTNPDDVRASQAIADMVATTPRFLHGCSHLLDSCLYPVSILEKTYRPSTRPGLRFELAKLTAVPHLDIDYSSSFLQLWEIDPRSGYLTGTRETPTPNRYIIHRGHLLQMPDWWGGPFRCLLFWWLSMTRMTMRRGPGYPGLSRRRRNCSAWSFPRRLRSSWSRRLPSKRVRPSRSSKRSATTRSRRSSWAKPVRPRRRRVEWAAA